MKRDNDQVVEIPIDKITVANPRTRGKNKFKQIVDNIARLGLKKPITVAVDDHSSGERRYTLVCGQGRLEAYKVLGETTIPAMLIHADRDEILLMSLVENLARRQHSPIELLRQIGSLKERGYSQSEIAKKIDLAPSYVKGILQLLEKGEERLIQAVEKREIPITIAITVARSNDDEVQRALTEAYENNTLRGKAVLTARRIIEQRRVHGKTLRSKQPRNGAKPVSTKDIMRTYRQETSRQKLVIKKAKICETKLLFAVSALKQLFDEENFTNLIRAEGLDSVPRFLAEHCNAKEQT